jgi:hypothetical protein
MPATAAGAPGAAYNADSNVSRDDVSPDDDSGGGTYAAYRTPLKYLSWICAFLILVLVPISFSYVVRTGGDRPATS